MKTIKNHRAEAILNKQYNYSGIGVMTRREFMKHCKNNGGRVYENTDHNYVAEEKERQWLSKNAFNHPFGNERHPQTIAYNKRKEALKEGIFVTTYYAELPMPGLGRPYLTTITKTEYDYFNTL